MPIICTLLEWAGLPCSLYDYVTSIYIFLKKQIFFILFLIILYIYFFIS